MNLKRLFQDTDDDEDVATRRKPQKRKKKLSCRRRSNDVDAEIVSDDEDVVKKKNVTKHRKSGKLQAASALAQAQPEPEAEEEREPEYIQLYCGINRSYDARNLDAATTYTFRVCAVNAAGTSEWSPAKEVTTSAAPPATVTGLQVYNLCDLMAS